jgi:hypothetical protein
MAQPVSGFQYTKFLQGAGTSVISEYPCVLHSVVNIGTAAGTVAFYDSATAAGTSATNNFYTYGTTNNIAFIPLLDIQTRYGLVAVTSGTVNLVVLTG